MAAGGRARRQRTRIGHLLHRLGFEPLAPLTPRRKFRARRESRAIDRTGHRCAQFVGEERRRISDDVKNVRLDLFAIEPTRKQTAHVFVGQLQSVARRHAEAEEVLVVHRFGLF